VGDDDNDDDDGCGRDIKTPNDISILHVGLDCSSSSSTNIGFWNSNTIVMRDPTGLHVEATYRDGSTYYG